MRRSPVWIFAMVVAIGFASKAIAFQQLEEKDKAVLRFDIDVQKVLKMELVKSLNLKELIENDYQLGPSPLDYSIVKRVSGGFSAPASLASLENTNDVPFEFYARFEFLDAADAKAYYGEFREFCNVEERDGKEFLTPGVGAMGNICIFQQDDFFEVASRKYFNRNDRDVFTDRVEDEWEKLGDYPVLGVLDAQGAGSLVKSIQDLLRSDSTPKSASIFADVADDPQLIVLKGATEGDPILSLRATCRTDAEANEVRSMVDGALGIGKAVFVMEGLNEVNQLSADIDRLIESLMNDLTAKGEGRNIDIVISRPKNMDQAIKKLRFVMLKRRMTAVKRNRFRQVVLAMHNYESAHGNLPFEPPADVENPMSWRTRLLPFMEQQLMAREMDRTGPWDNEQNIEFAEQMPEVFGSGGSMSDIAFVRPENYPKSLGNIADGTSNTVAFIEYPDGLPWTKSDGITVEEAIKVFDSIPANSKILACFYDGSVKELRADIDRDTLKLLFDPADGEFAEIE